MCTRTLAVTSGYKVTDMVCWLGPRDRVRDNELPAYRVGAVLRGSFGYCSSLGEGTLVAGSLLVGNACDCYRCRHYDTAGDRCILFDFDAEFLEHVRGSLGAGGVAERFRRAVVPPTVESAALGAIVEAVADGQDEAMQEAAFEVAAAALCETHETGQRGRRITPGDERRILQAVRYIEANFASSCSLQRLAAEARLSEFHFLRVFRRLTGQTPHRYVLLTRLRRAAQRLVRTTDKVVDIATAVGFGDLSNFNACFMRAFGRQPSAFRAARTRNRVHD